MSSLTLPETLRQTELAQVAERDLSREELFVLLLGPSATGKSAIIDELSAQTDGSMFEYVKPMITRPNRPGETDKVSISDEKFDDMQTEGEFVVVNSLYGVRYGTPLNGILEPLRIGKTPILDYPLDNIDALKRPEYETLNFYIYPHSIDGWVNRLRRINRDSNGRLEAGIEELGALATQEFIHPNIDISLVNGDQQSAQTASEIIKIIDQVSS